MTLFSGPCRLDLNIFSIFVTPSMVSRTCNLCAFLTLGVFIQSCLSVDTTSEPFQWKWSSSGPQPATGVLTECEVMHIELIKLSTFGSAPYYFMAYEPGGFSTATFSGTDPSDLTWQVKYGAETKLMLGMVDADGNSGGIADLYTVDPGKDMSCLPPMPSSSLVIKANVTKALSRCEPWGLRISGGTPPYNITLVMLDVPSTNITLPLGMDVLTYVNSGNSSGQMLAAVSDSTGQFGRTTPFIHTIGSGLGCDGLETTPGNSSEIPFYSNSNSSKRTTIIIAVCATIGGLIAITGATLFTLRRILARRRRDDQDTMPRAFEIQDKTEEHRQIAPIASSSTSAPDPPQPASHSGGVGLPFSSDDLWQQHNTQSFQSFDPNIRGLRSPAIASHHHSPLADPSLTPITSNITQPHRVRTHSHATRSADDEGARNTATSDHPTRGLPFAVQTQHLDPDTEPDIIIQHRDGGDLPPPYLDRL